jgi:lipopolysaccharide O-acetyltransferase
MRLAALLRSYGLYGLVRLALDYACTRLVFPRARLLRRPFYIRGSHRIVIGRGFTSGPGLRLEVYGDAARIVIGDDVQVNNNVHIAAISHVSIGHRVLIAGGVFIADHNHGSYSGNDQSDPNVPPAARTPSFAPVLIGDDTWFGEHVCVLPGVRVGKGVVVGAGAVVTADLPDYVIAVGAPARVIKRFDFASHRWVPVS